MINKNKTFIIAEAGVNHNANLKLAYQLIEKAAFIGADAIKFQTAIPEMVVTNSAKKAKYQIVKNSKKESQLDLIKKIHFPLETFNLLQKKCKKEKIIFFSSAFDLKSLDYLNNLNQKIHKIPSGEITNLPYLKKIGSFKKPIIMSTGMSNLKEIKDALNLLLESGMSKKNITILHCNTEYPTPFKDVNLKAMQTIKNKFNVSVGYSDHTKGKDVSLAAVALGAVVIEKHFTLDKKLPGPDHSSSLEPSEFKSMIESIRNVENSLGSIIKKPSISEKKNLNVVRKSIVAIKKISKGDIFTLYNLGIKRPGNGISPMNWEMIIGKKAKKNFKKDQLIS